jgi:hypothetical protein
MCHMSISLDGFVAGPDQSRNDALGNDPAAERGSEVHSWHLGRRARERRRRDGSGLAHAPARAYVMGRNMFGPIRGERDDYSAITKA